MRREWDPEDLIVCWTLWTGTVRWWLTSASHGKEHSCGRQPSPPSYWCVFRINMLCIDIARRVIPSAVSPARTIL